MILDRTLDGPSRVLDGPDELDEMRHGAVGYVFHGTVPGPKTSRRAPRATTNLLHFARCPKLDRGRNDPDLIWFPTIRAAREHLDEAIGPDRWRWCKHCQQDVTQRLLDE